MSEINKTTLGGNGTPNQKKDEAAPVETPTSATMEDILAELRLLREKDKEKDTKIAMLMEAADKGRMEHIAGRKPKDNITIVKLTYFEGKPVVAWRTMMNEVYKDGDNMWHEKQVVELTTIDGAKHVLELVDRLRLTEKRPATVISRNRTSDGLDGEALKEVFRVRLDDGRELELDGAFIN